jgi:hypothetical protein
MLLRVGSRGKEVKELQEFLEIGADGIFGKGTDKAVKTWQSSNGLIVDGIVGPATWDAMGLATTDNTESVYTTENGLVINKHFLPKGEYKNGPIKPDWLFIHHTAGWQNPYKCIDSWGRDSRGAIATEFVLGGQSVKGNDTKYDGEMVQAFPEGNYGWHLGKNGSQTMHKNSVAVEVCSFGYIKDGKTYAGTDAHKDQIVTLAKPFKGFKTWHRYSNAQIEALRKLILHLGDRDGIDVRAGLPALVKQKGADAFNFNEDAYYGRVKGLWTHTNTRKDKFDMFPQQELLDMLISL